MAIYRGAGGSGNSNQDSYLNAVTVQAVIATDAASAASLDATATAADVILTHADVVTTAAQTNADAVSTGQDATATAADVVATATSETNAATSASTASTQASTATTQAGVSTTKAGEASTSASNASTSASAAAAALVLTNADVVLTHADVVLAEADKVQTALDRVATNADVVLTHADVVLAEADKVQTGLDRAAVAADLVLTNQDTLDTAADVVLTNADVVSAEAAKVAAELAYDSFDDRYLGAKSSAPTTDNDNQALITGALYFNSTSGDMKVYNGSAWLDVYTLPSGLATETYVGTQISNLVDSSPAALNTLNELAAALGDDANFSTTVTNSIALKAPLASPSFTGTVSADGLVVEGASEIRSTLDATLNITSTAFEVNSGNVYGSLNFVTEDGSVAGDRKNAATIQAINSGGSGSYCDLDFYTSAGTGATNTRSLKIASNGDIAFYGNSGTTPLFFWDSSAESLGIGTTVIPDKLNIVQSSGGTIVNLKSDGTAAAYAISFNNSNGGVGNIAMSSTSTAYNTSSDYRLKELDVPMTGATERVKALRPINFAWKSDGSRVDGFLAHELAEVVPEAATGTKDAMRDEEYEVAPATGDVFTAGSEAGFTEVSPAIVASPAYYDVDGNVIKAEVIAQAAVHEAYDAVLEIIHSADVEQPETLEEGQEWRETTAAVMGTRSVPDMQGIDQSKLVPLLTATIQELIARIETLEGEV